MNYYADVILPLPIQGTFTYQLTIEQSKLLGVGYRVAVSFGKRKIYTGVIKQIHNQKPDFSKLKPIEFSYDKKALVTELQIEFWNWISKYYFTPIGDVLKAAIPSTFLLESDTIIIKKEIDNEALEKLTEEEFLIYEALDFKNLKINEVSEIIDKKSTYSIIQGMIKKNLVELNFEINEIYKPKLVRVIYLKKETINTSLDTLKKSPKQKEILLNIISKTKSNSYLKVKELKNKINFSDNSLKGLEEKGFISIKKIKIDRNESEQKFHQKINKLSSIQSTALNKINDQFDNIKGHFSVAISTYSIFDLQNLADWIERVTSNLKQWKTEIANRTSDSVHWYEKPNQFQIMVVTPRYLDPNNMPPHIKKRVVETWDKKYHLLDELRNRMTVTDYSEKQWKLFKQFTNELDKMRGTNVLDYICFSFESSRKQ